MNLCILLGKIISEIEFKFIIKGKNKSVAYFDIELLNKSIIRVKAYNEMADYIYRKLKRGQSIIVEGNVGDEEIECKTVSVTSTCTGSFSEMSENVEKF